MQGYIPFQHATGAMKGPAHDGEHYDAAQPRSRFPKSGSAPQLKRVHRMPRDVGNGEENELSGNQEGACAEEKVTLAACEPPQLAIEMKYAVAGAGAALGNLQVVRPPENPSVGALWKRRGGTPCAISQMRGSRVEQPACLNLWISRRFYAEISQVIHNVR